MADRLLLVGCYTAETGGTGTGITALARSAGAWEPVAELPLVSPSWLTAHPWLPLVYAVGETADGTVTALSVGAHGSLSALGTHPTGGADPCHLAVTPDGRFLVCANYSGGSIAVFGLGQDGVVERRTDLVGHHGSGPVADRQEAAHPHMVVVDPVGDLVVVDLGTDALHGYRVTDDGRLVALSRSALPPGTGPRQLVPAGHGWLLAAELSAQLLTLTGSAMDGFTVTGSLPASGRPGPTFPAQLTVTADGHRALVSNRGPDTITVFELTGQRPRRVAESAVGPGWPRHFCLLDDEVLVALQHADQVRSFDLHPDTGTLTGSGVCGVGTPACLLPL